MHLENFFNSKSGKYILSVLLGLGLASLFRTVCKDKNCIIFKAPLLEEIQDKTYMYNNKCYKYEPVSVSCDKNKKIVNFA